MTFLKLFLIGFLLSICFTLNAQNQWGLTIGSLLTTTKIATFPDNPAYSGGLKPHIGLQIGGYYRHNIKNFDLGVRTNYEIKGYRQSNSNSGKIDNINLNYWTLTPNIGYTFHQRLRLSMGVNADFYLPKQNDNISYKRIVTSLVFQIGYITPYGTIQLGYSTGRSAFLSQKYTGGTLQYNRNTASLSFDIPLSLKKK